MAASSLLGIVLVLIPVPVAYAQSLTNCNLAGNWTGTLPLQNNTVVPVNMNLVGPFTDPLGPNYFQGPGTLLGAPPITGQDLARYYGFEYDVFFDIPDFTNTQLNIEIQYFAMSTDCNHLSNGTVSWNTVIPGPNPGSWTLDRVDNLHITLSLTPNPTLPSFSDYTCSSSGSASGFAACTRGKRKTVTAIATVTDAHNNPVPDGFAVAFAVQPADLQVSGHDHSNINQVPLGSFNSSSCSTVNGTCNVTYQVPEVSGNYNITASGSPASPATLTLNVKVPGIAAAELSEFSGYFFLTGQPGRQTPNVPSSQHNNNHYGTQFLEDSVNIVAVEFAKLTEASGGEREELGINDMSLVWGGLFDICNDWTTAALGKCAGGHQLHRTGSSADIDNGVTVDSATWNPSATLKGPAGHLLLLKRLFCLRNMYKIPEGPIHFEVVPILCH